MTARTYLESAEVAILGTIESRGEAFAREILSEVEARLERTIGFGGLYVLLERMIERGYVTARYGEPSRHGGPGKRFYKVTPKGREERIRTLERLNRAGRVDTPPIKGKREGAR